LSQATPGDVTLLLDQLRAGRSEALDELVLLVYRELRLLARARVARERAGFSLQPTELVHEAFLRLTPNLHAIENRAHFFGAAAEAMRRILIERARRRARLRHGGELERTAFPEDVAEGVENAPESLLALDEALASLESNDARMAQVVKLRYFAGLTVPETAEALGISGRSVDRAWRTARAWLNSEMTRQGSAGGSVSPSAAR
jgi:RNA polymerase sigma factor (TIGR02999 family)